MDAGTNRNRSIVGLNQLLVILSLLTFAILSLSYINRPGLTYDEAMMTNAALGGIGRIYIFKKIFDIPLMIFPYHGALRAWYYYPIFKLFGINIFSVRIPTVFIAFCTLLIWIKNSRILFQDSNSRVLFILLITLDPVFINYIKFDYAYIAIDLLLSSITFALLLEAIKKRSLWYLSLMMAVFLIGFIDRLNFLWLIIAYTAAGCLCFPREMMATIKAQPKIFLSVLSIFLIIFITIMLYLVLPATQFHMGGEELQSLGWLERANFLFNIYVQGMSGNFLYEYMFQSNLGVFSFYSIIELLTVIIGFVCLVFQWLGKVKNNDSNDFIRLISFCFVVFMFVVLQVYLTRQARAPHHFILFWPFNHILFIYSLILIKRTVLSNSLHWLAGGVFALLISCQLVVNDSFFRSLSRPDTQFNIPWSPAIFDLARYVNDHADEYDSVLTLDMQGAQLFALANNNVIREKLQEEIWLRLAVTDPLQKMRDFMYPSYYPKDFKDNMQLLYDQDLKGKKSLVIISVENSFIDEKNAFFKLVAEKHLQINQLGGIADRQGRNIYYLFTVTN